MIDIHSHIIYGMDDGSPTMDETVRMLRKAQEIGITTIIATPHYQENILNLRAFNSIIRKLSK